MLFESCATLASSDNKILFGFHVHKNDDYMKVTGLTDWKAISGIAYNFGDTF